MFTNPANNLVYGIAGLSALGLASILWLAPLATAIVILNAVFAGSICGIIFAYWRLIVATVIGDPPFDRARQYALGVFAAWIALCLTGSLSILVRATGTDTTPYYIVAAARYFAIIGAWLQVTAPDFGAGFFAGKDRKVLWAAVMISVIVSIIMIVAQDQSVLAATN